MWRFTLGRMQLSINSNCQAKPSGLAWPHMEDEGMLRGRDKVIYGFVVMYIIMALCGCTLNPAKSEELGLENKETREFTEVLDKEWIQPSMDIANLDGWEVVEYMPDTTELLQEDYGVNKTFVLADGNYLYILNRYEKVTEETITYGYEWKSSDLLTMEQKRKEQPFSKADLESVFDSQLATDIADKIKQGYARVTSLDVSNHKINVFLTVWNETMELQHFYLLNLSGDGSIESIKDCVNSVWPSGADRLGQFNIPEAYCGSDGTIYLSDQLNMTLRLFNEDGAELKKYDLSEIIKEPIQYAGKSQDGTPIFYAEVERKEKLFFYAKEDDLHKLWQGKIEVSRCRLDPYGYMLMIQGDRLLTWNVLNGKTNCLYRFTGLSAYTCQEITRNVNGEILIYYELRGEPGFVYRLNDSEHPDIKQLVLLQSLPDQYTAQCAANYSRTHPGIRIKIEQMENQEGMEWHRLAADISNGNGPDLILANREQLDVLKEADMLCSLTKVIPQNELGKLFSGAIRFGMFENELYALPTEASLGVWMIRSDLYPSGKWKLEDLMNAYENWKKDNLRARRVECTYYNTTSTQLLYDFCLQNLENCEFIDYQSKKCNFKTDLFYRFLRFCWENGENWETNHYLSREEMWQEMLDGEAFLYYCGGTLVDYSASRNGLGDQYCTIGYPSADKNSSLVHAYRGMAINKLSKNKEVATDFLLSLINEENQVHYTTNWINRDVLTAHVRDQSGTKEGPYFQVNRYLSIPLEGREDGSSYLDEYMELMDSGESLSVQYSIQNIILEEVMAYFAGDKSEYEVADIIQNRIQNYLNEQK